MIKRSIFLITLLVVLYPLAGFCQEANEADEQLQAAGKQLELRRTQLELQESEANVNFRQQMQELELEERRIELEHQREKMGHTSHQKLRHKKCAVPFIMLCFVVHILAAVWVYQDIQKRKVGSGIWIVITLLAGLLGVLVYAIVRIGDSHQT